MTPAEWKEIAKALRGQDEELKAADESICGSNHIRTAALALHCLASVADHMAEWAEKEKK